MNLLGGKECKDAYQANGKLLRKLLERFYVFEGWGRTLLNVDPTTVSQAPSIPTRWIESRP